MGDFSNVNEAMVLGGPSSKKEQPFISKTKCLSKSCNMCQTHSTAGM